MDNGRVQVLFCEFRPVDSRVCVCVNNFLQEIGGPRRIKIWRNKIIIIVTEPRRKKWEEADDHSTAIVTIIIIQFGHKSAIIM